MGEALASRPGLLTLAVQDLSCLLPATPALLSTPRTVLSLDGFNQSLRGRIKHRKQSRDSLHLFKNPKYKYK